ncbi:MAG: molybdopterin-dependent oxidoreductase, partial [Desulfobacterales bacterium]
MEKIISTACCSHCGGVCLLKVHVHNGVITRIETDDGEEPQLRACLRCRAYRQRVYDPDRLKYPMRRIGERGEGRFERISWDQALDRVAEELNTVRRQYGPSSVLFLGGGGDTMHLHHSALIQDLVTATGGCSNRWGVHSFEGGLYSSIATYGTLSSLSDSDDLLNSRLIILWGLDPANTIKRTNTTWYLIQAREAGAKIISIDPRHTDSTATLADQWIPIFPGTDTAMLIAMAHVIIKENLQDQAFLDTYTVGFDKFRDYVLGEEDGVPKTPSWAAPITGVSAQTIKDLARAYAGIKPAALIAGIAPGRTAYGEQFHRATEILSAMTGNTGIHGGWSGRLHEGPLKYGGFDFRLGGFPVKKENPVEAGYPPRKTALPTGKGVDSSARIHFSDVADAIIKGKAGGFPADIKMLLVMQANPINQYPNSNKMANAFKKLDFIVVEEQVLSPTAKFADILLPVSTFLERNDIAVGGATPIYGFVNKVIEPLHESKSPLQICSALAERFGISLYGEKTEEEWLQEMVKGSYINDYNNFKEKAIFRVKCAEPRVAFKKQIENLQDNAFPTPSGKIEIFSQKLADMNHPEIPPIPKYIEPWEGRNDPLTAKYPLQLITTHAKRRAHTQFERVPWLREIVSQAVSINSIDAEFRDIRDGDAVRVFNDRG